MNSRLMPGGDGGSSCPVCGRKAKFWGSKESWRIAICTRCKHGFVDARPSLGFLTAYYERPDVISNKPSLRRRMYDDQIPRGKIVERLFREMSLMGHQPVRVLDVGAGWGWLSEECYRRGCDVSPLEGNRELAERIRSSIGIAPIAEFFETWKPDVQLSQAFDTIIMSQVLEHAYDPIAWLNKAAELLAPGGLILIAAPNFLSIVTTVLRSRDGLVCPPEHLNYFSARSLLQCATRCGFIVRKTYCDNHLTARLAIALCQQFLRPRWLAYPVGLACWLLLSLAATAGRGRYLYCYLQKPAEKSGSGLPTVYRSEIAANV